MRVKYNKLNDLAFYEFQKITPEKANEHIDEFTKEGTGEVIQFIQGNLFSPHKFIICDDDTKEFIEVNIKDCIKIK